MTDADHPAYVLVTRRKDRKRDVYHLFSPDGGPLCHWAENALGKPWDVVERLGLELCWHCARASPEHEAEDRLYCRDCGGGLEDGECAFCAWFDARVTAQPRLEEPADILAVVDQPALSADGSGVCAHCGGAPRNGTLVDGLCVGCLVEAGERMDGAPANGAESAPEQGTTDQHTLGDYDRRGGEQA